MGIIDVREHGKQWVAWKRASGRWPGCVWVTVSLAKPVPPTVLEYAANARFDTGPARMAEAR